MKKVSYLCFLFLPLFLVANAQAVSIDFEGLTATPINIGTITPVPASVLTDDFINDGVIFGLPGISAGVAVVTDNLAPSSGVNSVAGLDSSGNIPGTAIGTALGDIYFSFVDPGAYSASSTNFVSFTIGDAGIDVDIFDIRAYDIANSLIYNSHFENASRFLVSLNLPGINRVEIDFTGNLGYSMDDLTFNSPSAVPEPSAALFLFICLAGLLGLERKKIFKKS